MLRKKNFKDNRMESEWKGKVNYFYRILGGGDFDDMSNEK